MAPLEQTQRWLVETEAVAVLEQRVDPGEQTGVQCDGVAVRGELRCELGGDRIALGVGVGTGEVEEDACRPRQRLPAAFECLDGVDEGRFGAGAGDLLHLTQVLGHRLFEGGHEVVVGERREVGQTVQMRTSGQDRVRGHGPMVLRYLALRPGSPGPICPWVCRSTRPTTAQPRMPLAGPPPGRSSSSASCLLSASRAACAYG